MNDTKAGRGRRLLFLLLAFLAATALFGSLVRPAPARPAESAEQSETAPEESAPAAVPTPPPTPVPTPPPTPEPTPARLRSGLFGESFAERFTDGEIIQTENSYRSANVSVSYERLERDGAVYFLAEVYVSDPAYLRSAFAGGRYNGGFQPISEIAADNGAIVAITGDHYAGRYEGIVIRNGESYREIRFGDVCILYRDGRMETVENRALDLDALREADPWQVWCFGPALLDGEGRAKESFNTSVFPANPRSAIGYVEPGHYYLVEVEGSRGGVSNGSQGMDMRRLAELFESLGCACAYNLDGGRSVGFVWMGSLLSSDYNRRIPDIICVVDALPDGEAA